MKKLLALILCVVMVLSLAPAAFAAVDTSVDLPNDGKTTGVTTFNFESTKAVAKKLADAIKDTKDAIAFSYEELVGDQTTYAAISAVDSMIKDLVDNWADALDPAGLKADRDNSKNTIRHYVGSYIKDGIDNHPKKWIDSKGNAHPAKYAQYIAELASKALTDDKFVGAIEKAYADAALNKLVKDINDQLDEDWEAFIFDVDATLAANVGAAAGYDLSVVAPAYRHNYVDAETNAATHTDNAVWGRYPGDTVAVIIAP